MVTTCGRRSGPFAWLTTGDGEHGQSGKSQMRCHTDSSGAGLASNRQPDVNRDRRPPSGFCARLPERSTFPVGLPPTTSVASWTSLRARMSLTVVPVARYLPTNWPPGEFELSGGSSRLRPRHRPHLSSGRRYPAGWPCGSAEILVLAQAQFSRML
jgi:hypothetical protein